MTHPAQNTHFAPSAKVSPILNYQCAHWQPIDLEPCTSARTHTGNLSLSPSCAWRSANAGNLSRVHVPRDHNSDSRACVCVCVYVERFITPTRARDQGGARHVRHSQLPRATKPRFSRERERESVCTVACQC